MYHLDTLRSRLWTIKYREIFPQLKKMVMNVFYFEKMIKSFHQIGKNRLIVGWKHLVLK